MSKLRLALVTVLPLVCATPAFAQSSPSDQGAPPAMGQHHQMDMAARHKEMCTDMYAHRASHLAYLQAKLNLTDQQQAAWNKFRQAVLDEAGKERTACLDFTPNPNERPTVLEREAHLEKMLGMHLQALQATRPSLEALYNSLSAEQKATFDRSFEHHHGFGEGHMMGHGMGHGEGHGEPWGMHQPE